MFRYFVMLCLMLYLNTYVSGQNALDKPLPDKLRFQKLTIKQTLEAIEQEMGVVFTFSSSQFDETEIVSINAKQGNLEAALYDIFQNHVLEIKSLSDNKILLLPKKKARKFTTLSSKIIDAFSEEPLVGVVIINKTNGDYTTSDETGHFVLSFKEDVAEMEFSYIGYKTQIISFQWPVPPKVAKIELVADESLTPIIISSKVTDNLLIDPGTSLIINEKTGKNRTITGEKELIQTVKTSPGVQTNGEGQAGYIVRGGGADQNLILMDGVPIYEVSHTVGLSSVFIDGSIRSVEFLKTNMPARYGNRLSSVLNVTLKDGNGSKQTNSLSVGMAGLSFHTEGPLGKKWSYSVSARSSWLGFILQQFKKYTNYKEIKLSYQDAVGKFSYHINNTSKLSVSMYGGRDVLLLNREKLTLSPPQIESYFDTENNIKWSNVLCSVNYENFISNKWKLLANVGGVRYRLQSYGSYFNEIKNADTLFSRTTLDNLSFSQINDVQASASIDYYFNQHTKIRLGVGITHHTFAPTVRQSLVKLNQIAIDTLSDLGSKKYLNEQSVYMEINKTIGKFHVYPGLRLDHSKVKGASYNILQPRLKIMYIPSENSILSASYTKVSQGIQMLVNPGIGIPSDLWVPSTSKIRPAIAHHYNITAQQSFSNGLKLYGSYYIKNLQNVIEYKEPVDFFHNVVNFETPVPIYTGHDDWEANVEVGSEKISGLELGAEREIGKYKYWFTYSYSKDLRYFANIDDGVPFYNKNNRPHNINFGLSYEPSSKWNFGLQWVYASGNFFTLANESYDSVLGITLIGATRRNNYQSPPFHQASFSAQYQFKAKQFGGKLSFGIYNIYNRLNAYYIYAAVSEGKAKLYKVSIFPFMPHINATFEW